MQRTLDGLGEILRRRQPGETQATKTKTGPCKMKKIFETTKQVTLSKTNMAPEKGWLEY